MYIIYSFLYLVALILLLPYFIYREVKSPRYIKSLKQRLGFLPVKLNPQREPSLWIHTVSVGETIAAKPLILQLRQRYPDVKIFLSTTTITGHSVAEKSHYPVDGLIYFPFDFSFSCRRALHLLKPRLLLLMEGEIWPNLLRLCKKGKVKVILINGRISPRSYRRHRAIRAFFKRVLDNIDIYCMQSQEDAKRIIDIGASEERVFVSGNLKFDQGGFSLSEAKVEELKKLFQINQKDSVIIAGSTHQGEEEIVLQAFKRLKKDYQGIKLILAPRHPERCPQIEALLRQNQLPYIRRSELSPSSEKKKNSLFLLDTIGELSSRHHMENFKHIASQFLKSEAGLQVSNLQELLNSILLLLTNRQIYEKMSQNARRLVVNNRGAAQKTMKAIEELLA